MSFKLIGNHLSPSDGEVVVRTYHCTYLSPIFALIGLKTDGYLTVTNKRVVYFAEGSSMFGVAGHSKLYKEVSIADVSNLSLGKGTRFSILRLLFGLVFSQIAGAVAALLLSGVMLALKGAAGGGSPYSLRFGVFLQLVAAVILVARSTSISSESIVRVMLAASGLWLVLSVPALGLSDLGALMSMPLIYLAGIAIMGVPLAGYWLWCLYWFMRREYLTMAIASKTGLATPIKISGMSWWGRINVAADLASGMAAAVDADIMFRELGAIVTDIQTLGDHGVEKWLENTSSAVDENLRRQDRSYGQAPMRYALAAVVLIGAFVGGESVWYAISAKKARTLRAEAAMKADAMRIESEKMARMSSLRTELAKARNVAENDPSIREWVPTMWALAEQKASDCEMASASNQYEESVLRLREAIDVYAELPNAASAMKAAADVQSRYSALMAGIYVQESVSERLRTGRLMEEFAALMNQHPRSNDNWKAVGLGVDKAKLNAEQDKWDVSRTAWEYAGSRFSPAIQLMRADLWVGLAEKAIKEGDASGAYECAVNATKESVSHPNAGQRKELASNMLQYSKQFDDVIDSGTVNARNMAEFIARLNLLGGTDWVAIKGMVENAKALAGQNEWEKCNTEWKAALSKLPATILAMQKEKIESDLAAKMGIIEAEARRGNWAVVSAMAGEVLNAHPGHLRAKVLKEKADSIEGAIASEKAYQLALSDALFRESKSNHIKMGDMSDFAAHMDRYCHEEWAQVLDTVNRAGSLSSEENGADSSNEWAKACAQLSSAVQRMRAEVWVEKAEQEAASTNWAKALIYAENALKEKPGHVEARQLRDQADQIEVIRGLRSDYDQLLKEAADDMPAMGGTSGDQNALDKTLSKYGGAAWKEVQELVKKASELDRSGQRMDSIATWKEVLSKFPAAMRKSHAGYWVEEAETDAKASLWGKVSIEAEKALAKDPENERAKALKAEADKNSK